MLQDINTPLRLADGTLIYPKGKEPKPAEDDENNSGIRLIEVPTNREAQRIVVETRRRVSDLPDIPRTMNVVSVVLSYTLYGLDDTEIAIATNLSEQQIATIKGGDAYAKMYATVVQGILEAEAVHVRDIFTQNARKAAGIVVEGLDQGSRGDKILAAKEVLDRGGFRPADIVEHRHKLEGGLTIEIVKKQTTEMPVIDLVVEE